MTETECLAKMVPPTGLRPSKPYRGCVIQVHVSRACDRACFNCTQGSQLSGKPRFISVENFETCLKSLVGFNGVAGMFGGNCALHPKFFELCDIMAKYLPKEQLGIWCNNPLTVEKAAKMREVFTPEVSNLNVHLDRKAYDLFKQGWPQCNPVGLDRDSRHSPPFVAMRDVVRKRCPDCYGDGTCPLPEEGVIAGCGTCRGSGKIPDESSIYDLISNCDINQKWSALCGEFRGQARAWFCEIAGAQSILHQDEPDYPDTGIPVVPGMYFLKAGSNFPQDKDDVTRLAWWQLSMDSFTGQVRKHCFDCGIPLRGHGVDAQASEGAEQVSQTHQAVYKSKVAGRTVELVTDRLQLGKPLENTVRYLQNSEK